MHCFIESGRKGLRVAICLAAMSVLWPMGAGAAQDPRISAICYEAIERAIARYPVPRDVMLAISLTETGRMMGDTPRPWPWTVNMEGKGVWFDTGAEALAFVNREFARGARSFDVGCFQINYKWHHQHFQSIEAMFDPVINATYAAKFLAELYMEKGNWADAAGAYHSRTPSFANRYAARFERYRKRIRGGNVPVFVGNGSEPLRVAQAELDIVRRGGALPPLNLQLGRREPLLSPTASPRGGLVAPAGGGLLLSPKGALF